MANYSVGKLLVKGKAGAPGVVQGTVQVLTPETIEQIMPGNILVINSTEPGQEAAMKKAGGFVTNVGGKTHHTVITAKILGKPCVVGTYDATTVLKTGQKVVVDGNAFEVYEAAGPDATPVPTPTPAPAKTLAEKMQEIAKAKGITLPPGVVEKLKES